MRNTEKGCVFSKCSDHGYSLGQYRLPTHKMQVYENTLRVPFFIRGPGIEAGLQLPIISGFVDLCPTIVQLASGLAPSDTDGRSFVRETQARAAPTCRQPESKLLWNRLVVVD
jgi:arylsulfatase A-like enzyme